MSGPTSSIDRQDCRGSALIITLGLLAVMIILAVSFSISSRTERLASRYYVDVVKTRQLTHTALNRIIGYHIRESIGNKTYPDWTGDVFTSGPGPADEDSVFFLHNSSMGINTGAALFVTGSILDEAIDADGVKWIKMENDAGEFICEYAFLVANNSGLLDAHVIGAREDTANFPEPRSTRGFDPGEIRFSSSVLPEVIAGAPLQNLAISRELFGRFENVPELHWLLSETDARLSYRGPPLLKQYPTAAADNLHVFSRFPSGYARANANGIPEAVTNVAYIGGDPADWDIPAIKNVLSDFVSDGTIPDDDAFVGALYDYANPDYELYPIGGSDDDKFNRISSKPVPMITEIVVSNKVSLNVTATNSIATNTVYITVETWYPFSVPAGSSFNVRYGTSPSAVPDITMDSFGTGYTAVPGFGSVNFTPSATSGSGFNTTTFAYSRVESFPSVIADGTYTFVQTVNFTEPFFVYAGPGDSGPIVDRVLPNWPSPFEINAEFSIANGTIANGGEVAKFVTDPRINWDPGISGQWQTGSEIPSLGSINATVPSSSDELMMYARMAPLRSVGEIGYLLYDAAKPWNTIKLAGPDTDNMARLLDRFTVHTNLVRKGLVNPNTRQRDALAAALWGVYAENHPEISSPRELTVAEARTLADNLISYTTTQSAFTNISDVTRAWDQSTLNALLGAEAATNKFFRESVIRNTAGLLSPRQNLFTIFVAARTFSDGYTYNPSESAAAMREKRDNTTSEQRAVAVVWRDPYLTSINYPGGGSSPPTYQSWIQYFHWFSGIFEE